MTLIVLRALGRALAQKTVNAVKPGVLLIRMVLFFVRMIRLLELASFLVPEVRWAASRAARDRR